MRALIQRVSHASVTINHVLFSHIERGFLVFVGVEDADEQTDVDYLVKKISNMRIFQDENGKMNRSIADVDGAILVVSQFTLFADTKKGNRPSFMRACSGVPAKMLYEAVISGLKSQVKLVECGVFGADMQIELENDGPVTIWIDSKNRSY